MIAIIGFIEQSICPAGFDRGYAVSDFLGFRLDHPLKGSNPIQNNPAHLYLASVDKVHKRGEPDSPTLLSPSPRTFGLWGGGLKIK